MTQPFYFPDGRLAHNAEDLLELCQQDPDAGTNFLVRQDLEQWLAYIGSYELAECAANARQTELEDRQKLEEFINRSHSLTRSQAVPAAVTQTPIAQNLTAPESAEEQPEERVDTSTAERATAPAIEESKQLAQVESILSENQEESLEPPTSTPKQTTEPAVEESKQLAQVESKLQNKSEASTAPASATTTSEAEPKEKLSFFQVIAKFIVKILYRNKA